MKQHYGFDFDNSYTRLPEVLFSHSQPQPVADPQLVLFNAALAEQLGLDPEALGSSAGAQALAGNSLPDGSTPIAQAYAGHQFAHLSMLGDGRAILLGEHLTPSRQRVDIQLKGAGRTVFSRGGDGRAALGPMLREYLISEAMAALNIPTTRSLAVVSTGEQVHRESALPGAILTRVAASHLRVGTFQYVAGQQDKALLQALVDYTLARHYPERLDSDNQALALLEAVMDRQITLVVEWMRVGFIHGVLNTDNVTLSGETIDYGPCAFMDDYDADTVFSSIDHQGRYAFGNQPMISQWNLSRFAETLLPLIDDDIDNAIEQATALIKDFTPRYAAQWQAMMKKKLGLFGEEDGDDELINDLLQWMQQQQADYTNTFRELIGESLPNGEPYQNQDFQDWHQRWQRRLERNRKPLASSWCLMRNHNPAVIARNHQVEKALSEAEQGDLSHCQALLHVLQQPYADRDLSDPWRQLPSAEEKVCATFCGT